MLERWFLKLGRYEPNSLILNITRNHFICFMVQIGNILFILWKDRLQQAIQFIQCIIVVDIFYRIFYYRFVDMDLSDRSFYKFGEVYVIWSELLGVRLVIELVGLVSSARFHLYSTPEFSL